jgi:hypothetical protein
MTLKKSEEACVTGVEGALETIIGDEITEVMETKSFRVLEIIVRIRLSFLLG